MNFDNTSSILEPNESIIKTGLHIILTTDEDDLRPGNFNEWRTQDQSS
jgi:hypothetical protein